jgi:hypothetical protein
MAENVKRNIGQIAYLARRCGVDIETYVIRTEDRGEKYCPRCQQWLPQDAFGVRGGCRRKAYCDPCTPGYLREWRAKRKRAVAELASREPSDIAAMLAAADPRTLYQLAKADVARQARFAEQRRLATEAADRLNERAEYWAECKRTAGVRVGRALHGGVE